MRSTHFLVPKSVYYLSFMKRFFRYLVLTAVIFPAVLTMSCNKDDEKTTFTVTFDVDGGMPKPDDQKVEKGNKATRPSIDPSKTGFIFNGWYNGDRTVTFNFANTPITQSMTLKAKWEKENLSSLKINIDNISHNSATIRWNKVGESVTYSIYLNESVIDENITQLNYTFTGLNEQTDYTGKVVARNLHNDETFNTFSFTTEKFYLKYLKKFGVVKL